MELKAIELNQAQMHTTQYALQSLIDQLMNKRAELDKDSKTYKELSKKIGWCIYIKQKFIK